MPLYLTPINAHQHAHVPDYSQCEDKCQPDQAMSIQDIIKYSAQGVSLGLNMYSDYDDSDEGANFPTNYDQFDAREDVLRMTDTVRKARKTPKKEPTKEPVPPEVEPLVEL